jgi:O-methyltransferase
MNLPKSTIAAELGFERFFDCLYGLCFIIYFIFNSIGKEYRINHLQKLKLTIKTFQINKKFRSNIRLSLVGFLEQLILVHHIFRVPKLLKGDVVECGCCNGLNTISMSVACALTSRRLIVCDSFRGLPKPRENEGYTVFGDTDTYLLWQEGDFASVGGLEAVKERINKFGNLEACQFIEGYFKDTLKDINTDSIVLIFEDADLPSSVEDCLRYLWPKLKEGCGFYSHEPWSLEIVSLFFDKEWWEKELQTGPPGFFMSGKKRPAIGYAIRRDFAKIKKYGKGFLPSR